MKITTAEFIQHTFTGHTAGSFFTKEKNKLLYVLSVMVFACCCAYFFGSMMQQSSSLWSALIFSAIFLCAGIIHIFLFPRWMPPSKEFGFNRNLLYSIAVATGVFFVSMIVFWSNHFHLKILCLVAGISFLLPALVMECFQIFNTLPKVVYAPWQLPAGAAPEKKMSLLLNSILFKIHVQLKKTDNRAVLFNITLPRKLTVDTVFHHFFNDHKETIELYENNQPYGWHFFIKTWYGIKAVDPNLSLAANGIKEEDVIYAKRVSTNN